MLFSSGLFLINNLLSFVIYIMKSIPQLTHATNVDNSEIHVLSYISILRGAGVVFIVSL